MERRKVAKIQVSIFLTIGVMAFGYGLKKDFLDKNLIPEDQQIENFRTQGFSQSSSQKSNKMQKPQRESAKKQSAADVFKSLNTRNLQIVNHQSGLLNQVNLTLSYETNGIEGTINILINRVFPKLRFQKNSSFKISSFDNSTVRLKHYYGGAEVKNSWVDVRLDTLSKTIISITNKTILIDSSLLTKEVLPPKKIKSIFSKSNGLKPEKIKSISGPFVINHPSSGKQTMAWELKAVSSSKKGTQTFNINAENGSIIK